MYKILLNILIAAAAAMQLRTQNPIILNGTAWKGTLNVPSPAECELTFNKDTIRMIYTGAAAIKVLDGAGNPRIVTGTDSVTLELMTYTLSSDTLTMRKVSGGSPCGDEKGIYQVKKKDDTLHFTLVSDGCTARKYCFTADMTQIK